MKNNFDVAVIGLGYVGLTLSVAMAEAGLRVYGSEKREDVLDKLSCRVPHFSEVNLASSLSKVIDERTFEFGSSLKKNINCDCYIITVGTPLSEDGLVRLDMIRNAASEVADHMEDGALVILRSTVRLRCARDIVYPILKNAKKKFYLAVCPERTLEGNALAELRLLPQIIGADDQLTRDMAVKIFKCLTNKTIEVSSYEAAELIKLVDNTYRDTRFAFSNEVARISEAYGVNIMEVIAAGKLGYSRTDLPLPGLVGGPCLEKDPHILAQSAADMGIEMEITKASRLVNERQPAEAVQTIHEEFSRRGLGVKSKITILGMAFKGRPETDDLRGSMSIKVYNQVRRHFPKANYCLFDPVVGYDNLSKSFPEATIELNLDEACRDASLVIIANNHPIFSQNTLQDLLKNMNEQGFVYDFWNTFPKIDKTGHWSRYFAIGNI